MNLWQFFIASRALHIGYSFYLNMTVLHKNFIASTALHIWYSLRLAMTVLHKIFIDSRALQVEYSLCLCVIILHKMLKQLDPLFSFNFIHFYQVLETKHIRLISIILQFGKNNIIHPGDSSFRIKFILRDYCLLTKW